MPRSATRGLGRSFSRRPSLLLDQTTLEAHAQPRRRPVSTCQPATKSSRLVRSNQGHPGRSVWNGSKEPLEGPPGGRRQLAPSSGPRQFANLAICGPVVHIQSGPTIGPFFSFQIFPNSSQASWRTRHSSSRTRGGDGNQGVDKSHSWDRGHCEASSPCLRRHTVDTCRGLRLRRHSGPRRG